MIGLGKAVAAAIALSAAACTDPAAILTHVGALEETIAPAVSDADSDARGSTVTLTQNGKSTTRSRTSRGTQTVIERSGGNSAVIRQVQR